MKSRTATISDARSPPSHLRHARRVATMHRYSAEEKDGEAPGVAYTLTNA